MKTLIFKKELTPPRFAGIGRPTGGFRREDGQFVALCSEFDRLFWQGRQMSKGHKLLYRLSLYDGNLDHLIGVFDDARYPINDVAFHPSRPLVAIGTGSYDGGWCFEGDLLLWDWESGETFNLLGESREVVKCRFIDDRRLAVLLRPRDEDDFQEDDDNECVGLIIDNFCDFSESGYKLARYNQDPRLVNLKPVDPKDFGFNKPVDQLNDPSKSFFNAIKGVSDFEQRGIVWDILFLSEDKICVVHEKCHLEIWDTQGK